MTIIRLDALKHLAFCGYHYDVYSEQWSLGRVNLDEWQVKRFVILWARDRTLLDEKGVFADDVLALAKQTPELTITPSFLAHCKSSFGRGKRTGGKAAFALWCWAVGIDIPEPLVDFTAKKSLLVNNFYNYLAKFAKWLGRVRIEGPIARNVFVFGGDDTAGGLRQSAAPPHARTDHHECPQTDPPVVK